MTGLQKAEIARLAIELLVIGPRLSIEVPKKYPMVIDHHSVDLHSLGFQVIDLLAIDLILVFERTLGFRFL